MASRLWTADEEHRMLELHRSGCTATEIAAVLDRTAAAVRLKLISRGFSSAVLRPASTSEAALDAASLEEPISPAKAEAVDSALTTIDEDLQRSRHEFHAREAREARRKYEEVLRQRVVDDRIVEIFRERLVPFGPFEPPPRIPPKACEGRIAESAVLLIGDPHIGQVVSRSQTGGFGDYSPLRFIERLHHLQETVARMLAPQPDRVTDALHVFLLGDIVHGALQHNAEREDTLLLADQFQLAIWTLFQALVATAAAVPQMHIYTVVGNHGRWPNQKRMPTVNRYSNLDHLVYASLQFAFAQSPLEHVQFHLNDSPRQNVTIKNATLQASHGDHLKGGDTQFRIPAHAMAREVNSSAQRHAAAQRPPIDIYVCGDKHRAISLPLARGSCIVNGSFVGADEYSVGFPPSEPVQVMFWLHPQYRLTWQHFIKLEFAPELETLPYALPEATRYLVEEGYGVAPQDAA